LTCTQKPDRDSRTDPLTEVPTWDEVIGSNLLSLCRDASRISALAERPVNCQLLSVITKRSFSAIFTKSARKSAFIFAIRHLQGDDMVDTMDKGCCFEVSW
jgi:hypothetical protein